MPLNNNFETHKTYAGVPNIFLLSDSKGLSYSIFRKCLKPNYPLIIINFLTPLLMIFLAMLPIHFFINSSFIVLYCIPCTIWVGFWIQAYSLHFHEAAHFNLVSNKNVNDIISNIFLTPFTGILVKDYRISHWKHHLNLGNVNDTEISYHKPINIRQMLESLFGIYLIKSAFRYFGNFNKFDLKSNINVDAIDNKNNKSLYLLISISLMMITQIGIFIFLYKSYSLYMGLVWLFGFYVVSPFFAQIRQCLEHRSFNASISIDYSVVDHGPINRIFGDDLFSRYFGAVGFNKHLLHHCDPLISYTRFKDLSIYLNDTKLKNFFKQNTTSYLSTFITLFKK